MKKSTKTGRCLGCILLIFCFELWIVFSLRPEIICKTIGILTAAGYIISVFIRHHRDLQGLSGGWASYAAAYPGLTDDELAKIVILEELRSQFPHKLPLCKASFLHRMLYTVGYCLINFLLIHFCYHTEWIIIVCSLLTLVYVHLLLSTETPNALLRLAKKHSGKPFSELIRENVYDESQNKTAQGVFLVGLSLILASLVAFFCLNANPRMTFTEDQGGYCLSEYRPGLTATTAQIPATHNGQPVVAIADRVFDNCQNLTQISIPSTVVRIGGGAFANCTALQTITIPQGVTEIRGNTFENCSSLSAVSLPDHIVKIHAYAFQNCSSLESIRLPSQITDIHTYCFNGCSSLKAVVIPEGVTRIAAHAFHGCSDLSSVTLPDSLREIGSSAFRECGSLMHIEIPLDATINERAFKDSPTTITWR